MNAKNSGFTLIEVLIASFIMFISLAVFTFIFRGALLSSERADTVVASTAYTSLIMDKISASLKQHHQESSAAGQGDLLAVKYQWQAQVKKIAHPPARYLGTTLKQADHSIKLWVVKMKIIVGKKEQNYSFEDVTW